MIPQGNYLVSLIEGDGIGPEIAVSVKDIFAAAKVRRNDSHFRQHATAFSCSLLILRRFILDAHCMGILRRHPYPKGRQDRYPRRCH